MFELFGGKPKIYQNRLKTSENLQKILDTIAAILGIFGLIIANIEVSLKNLFIN